MARNRLKPKAAAIFDLDGVLVDTAEHHFQAWRELAERLGVPFDRQRNEALRGVDRMTSLLLLLGDQARRFTEGEKVALCAEKNASYVRRISALTPADLLPGTRELLLALRAQAVPVAVASSSKNARLVIARLGIADLLATVVDGNEELAAKPAPDLFLAAATRLGVLPAHCVVIEDAAAGIAAARSAGMRAVGVGAPESLNGADFIVSVIAELTVTAILRLAAGVM